MYYIFNIESKLQSNTLILRFLTVIKSTVKFSDHHLIEYLILINAKSLTILSVL